MVTARAKDANRITLWGVGTARTLRVHWALAELGLAYDTRPIAPRSEDARSPAFTGLTARQKVAVLQDDGFVITESAAIVIYLSDTYS